MEADGRTSSGVDNDPETGENDSADEGHRHCGFNGNVKLFIIVGSIIPADDNTGTDRCSGKEHDDHIDDAGG